MKPIAVIALSLLVIGGLGWWLLGGEPATTPQRTDVLLEPSATDSQETELAAEKPAVGVESASVTAARQRIEDATLALQVVVAERKSAEAELQQAERDVAALERFIEEIEKRGEDPVDYADEGLAKFQPAFYAYQDAFDRLELAETMEQVAAEELAGAGDHLARILAEPKNNKQ